MLTSVQEEHTTVVFMPRAITPRGHSTVLANEVFMVMGDGHNCTGERVKTNH